MLEIELEIATLFCYDQFLIADLQHCQSSLEKYEAFLVNFNFSEKA
jgi:hypothetical protein